MTEELLIRYENVEIRQKELVVLKDVNLQVRKGEFIYLIGKVGSGKSSLLKTFYYELLISEGEASIYDYNLRKLKRREIPLLRRKIGIVFQDFQLLTDRSVQKNLEFVLKATGWKSRDEMDDCINKVLREVGMSNKGYKMPHELSGGEQQRIVIARALLNAPDLILADEPTGNLDVETGTQILELLKRINELGTTVIMSTHNLDWVSKFPAKTYVCDNNRLTCLKPDIEVEKVQELKKELDSDTDAAS